MERKKVIAFTVAIPRRRRHESQDSSFPTS